MRKKTMSLRIRLQHNKPHLALLMVLLSIISFVLHHRVECASPFHGGGGAISGGLRRKSSRTGRHLQEQKNETSTGATSETSNTCPCSMQEEPDDPIKDTAAADSNSSNNNVKTMTIRMLAVGGDNHYLNFVGDRFSLRAQAFYNRTGVKVEVVRVGELDNVNDEIFADVKAKVYDGYVFLPFITGDLVEQDGLADLTDFVRTNQDDVQWPDIFRFNREMQSVYDNVVRLLPCDGDVHSLYYRKDLFERFNIQVPRTWDEYTAVAKFFHGMQVEKADGSNETVTLSGSCVERKRACHENYYFNNLVHVSSTQAAGTTKGAFLDPQNFEPLMGEAMAETLRHLENQARYGSPDELQGDSCDGLNIASMNEGRCAMTYFWGDIFARHLLPGSVLPGKLGIAPTPGVTKVLNRQTGKLDVCTAETCPYGVDYPDLGRVSYAPYAAAGGWSVGVSGGVSPERQAYMAEFFGLVCGAKESIDDVIPNAQGPLFTGTDPYRVSQLNNVSKWVERGYPRDTTLLYKKTIEEQLSSPNTVLDVRFPEANAFLKAMHDRIYKHVNESQTMNKTHDDRIAVAHDIEEAWREITKDYDARDTSTVPLKTIYQKSLNVYVAAEQDKSSDSGLEGGAIAGIVVACSLLAALATAALFYWFMKRQQQKSLMAWQIKKDEIQITPEVIGEGSFGVILKGTMRGTPVAVKPSRHDLLRHYDSMDSGGSMSKDTQGGSSHYHQSSNLRKRQLQEDLSALIKLRSTHVVQIIGALVDKKSVLVVFEYMENGSLSSLLANGASVAGREGRPFEMQWACQIAKGLEFLHDVPPPVGPLLHEDLKASHILIDSSYNAKISNFALEARVVGSRPDQGSLLWTAPEVLNGERPSKASDVYSFGMLLFELMARARPFRVRRFSKSNLTDYTISTISAPDEDEVVPSTKTKMDQAEYFGQVDGEKLTLPEIVARVSDLDMEPAVRPDLPDDVPGLMRDICVECWHKNPNRRPTMAEIVDRGHKCVGKTSLTEKLARTSSIFDSILPHHVQEALARKEKIPPQTHDNVTVIFSDIVSFTATSSMLTAEEVGDLIGRLFTKYDTLAEKYGVKKLDVIGDAFLGVTGINPNEPPDHAPRAAGFAMEAIEEARKTPICHAKPNLGCVNIRFGLATGAVVASVIGSAHHPKYTLFGTTVNTASRMESSSEPNRTQCTEETAALIREQAPSIGVHYRKKMDIKGRGQLDTYFLTSPEDGFKAIRLSGAAIRQRSRNTRRSMGDISDKRVDSFQDSLTGKTILEKVREEAGDTFRDENSTETFGNNIGEVKQLEKSAMFSPETVPEESTERSMENDNTETANAIAEVRKAEEAGMLDEETGTVPEATERAMVEDTKTASAIEEARKMEEADVLP